MSRDNNRNVEGIGVWSLGAVMLEIDTDIDSMLIEVSEYLKALGLRVRGYYQREVNGSGNDADLQLASYASNDSLDITQNLGSGSSGCKVDATALVRASVILEQEMDDGADLLIINRFGRCESEDQGFLGVIEKACFNNIPVLIGVRPRYRDAWLRYASNSFEAIQPNSVAIAKWIDYTLDLYGVGSESAHTSLPQKHSDFDSILLSAA